MRAQGHIVQQWLSNIIRTSSSLYTSKDSPLTLLSFGWAYFPKPKHKGWCPLQKDRRKHQCKRSFQASLGACIIQYLLLYTWLHLHKLILLLLKAQSRQFSGQTGRSKADFQVLNLSGQHSLREGIPRHQWVSWNRISQSFLGTLYPQWRCNQTSLLLLLIREQHTKFVFDFHLNLFEFHPIQSQSTK